jgi:glycosyltransferase involved in cell wall biosynthesis
MEYADLRAIGLRHPVAIVPNGIDVPKPFNGSHVSEPPASRGDARPYRLLYLGRLHPIKGIELLLEAWNGLQVRHPRWELVVAGGGASAYVASLRKLAKSLRLERLHFFGPVFGERKSQLYHASDIFVLPTKSENFGMAVAEALGHGLPVITTRRAPWTGLVDHRCGWWVERTHEDLSAAMEDGMQLADAVRMEMGHRGRQWMLEEFDWDVIGSRMEAVYRWLRFGGEPPPWVKID